MEKLLIDAITAMEEEDTLRITGEMLEGGTEPMRILELCREAMERIGEGFEAQEYFLPDLIMAGEIVKQINEMVKPELAKGPEIERIGKVVIGTVAGDIHDLGKDIVVFMLDINGFEVHDLGVDVPANTFVGKVKEVAPEVVGLSGFLTLAFDAMKDTVEAIEEAGLRDKVKIMIGGGAIDEQVLGYVKADAYGKDAMEGVELARQWVGGE
ncbi:MAG: cobalamin-dependent protein [Actinobacteria bacterium]|nr:cobalamin-dependent protein [Actinomycetota bacterium]